MRLKSLVASLVASTSLSAQNLDKKGTIGIEWPYFGLDNRVSFPLVLKRGVNINREGINLNLSYGNFLEWMKVNSFAHPESDIIRLGPVPLRSEVCDYRVEPNITYLENEHVDKKDGSFSRNINFDGQIGFLYGNMNKNPSLEDFLEMRKSGKVRMRENVTFPYDLGAPSISFEDLDARVASGQNRDYMASRTAMIGTPPTFDNFIYINPVGDIFSLHIVGAISFRSIHLAKTPHVNSRTLGSEKVTPLNEDDCFVIQIDGTYLGSEKSK